MRNIFGDQGNKERNFWEQGNSAKVNFGEHLNLFLRDKGTTVNFHREQGNMPPTPRRPSLTCLMQLSAKGKALKKREIRTTYGVHIAATTGRNSMNTTEMFRNKELT